MTGTQEKSQSNTNCCDDRDDAVNHLNYSVESDQPSTSKQTNAKEKAPRASYTWVDVKTFSTVTEAHKYLIEQNFSKRDRKVDKDKSVKTKYRCKTAKVNSKKKCKCIYRIYEPSYASNQFIVQHNRNAHNHHELDDEDKSIHFPLEMINLIIDCSKKRMAAKRIIEHLKDLQSNFNLFVDEKIPSQQQMYYLIRKHKDEETPPMISIGQMAEWCEKHSNVPTDDDEPFVFAFETSGEDKNMFFRFAVSTKRMLADCIGLKTLCVDATYKLNWHGFPFLVTGTVDRNKKFHPLCFSCTSREAAGDFAFLFNAMRDSIADLFDVQFEPTILIADGADSIRNAFKQVFPLFSVMIMCYAHMMRAVTKRPLNDKRNRNAILSDIRKMNLAPTSEIFQMMSKLFLDKWQGIEPDLTEYFESEWLGSHCNWFESAAIYSPSTNNNLEGI